MSIVKGVLKYLFILIGIIFAVGVIALGIMYIFPSVNLFGYSYYNGGDYQTINAYPISDKPAATGNIHVDASIVGNFDVLELKTDAFDISVKAEDIPAEYSRLFSYVFATKMKGFKNVDDKTPYVDVRTTEREVLSGQGQMKVLSFEVVEPRGVFIRNDTSLAITLPTTSCDFKYLIVTNNSGSVVLGNNKTNEPFFNIESANITSDNGSITLRNTNISKDLTIKKSFGKVNVNNDILANVNLDCGSSTMTFKNIGNSEKSSTVSVTNGDYANLNFGDIYGNANVIMKYGLFKANNIQGEFSSVSTENIKNSCDVNIQSVSKTLLVDNESGKIEIGQTSNIGNTSNESTVNITSSSGEINISKCFANLVKIKNGRGKVTLNKCTGSLDVSTTYGSVYVNYLTNEDTIQGVSQAQISSAVAKLKNTTLKIETGRDNSGDGSINVYGITSKNFNINSLGSGTIKASINSINGDANVIRSNRGAITVETPKNNPYLLKWKAKRSSDVHAYIIVSTALDSAEVETASEEGWLSMFGASASTTNKLEINSKNSSVTISEPEN